MLIVGDIQGDAGFVEKVLALNEETVFVGDYLDSFTFSPAQQAQALELVLSAVENRAGVVALFGNHEMSYLNPIIHGCSGWNAFTDSLVGPMKARMRDLSPFFLLSFPGVDRPILITHAGLSKQVWDAQHFTIENMAEKLNDGAERMRSKNAWFYRVGYFRGGGHGCGGPLWCDWNAEFTPVPELIQIVGHSSHVEPVEVVYDGKSKVRFEQEMVGPLRRSNNGDWNIDCLQRAPVVLEITNEGEFRPREVD